MSDLKALVKDLNNSFEEIKESLDLKKKKERLAVLESEANDKNLWDDQEKARKLMQELGDIKNEIEEVEKLNEDLSTLLEISKEGKLPNDFEKEIRNIEKAIEKLKIGALLSDKYDRKNAILSIHAGQGGTEAMDWTSMLYRMYLKYGESKDWKVETIDISEGEEAGLKSVTLKINGPFAYGYLKGEAGTHRLVRQSPFNADKLRQTSFALVEVLPELEEVDMPDIEIKDEDLDWQFYRAGSQGGQNVNKVSTAVRLIHKPTNIVVTAQTERFQEQNRKAALSLLRSKLWLREKFMEKEEKEKIKGSYRPASWGNQIRSYVLHPYKMIKDLRTEVERNDPENVLSGDLDDFINAELAFNGK